MDVQTVSETPVKTKSPRPFLLRDASEPGEAVSTRYEYRAWFRSVPRAVETLQRCWDFTIAQRRTDIYLLSPAQPLTLAKLRGGQHLEVKRLLRCAGPHQIWAIKRYGAFPLTGVDISRFAELMGVRAQAPGLNGVDADTIVSSLMETSVLVEPVAVRKSRLLFRRGDCQGEITRIQAIGFQAITLAIETDNRCSADREIRSLRLTEKPNIAYGEALWRGVFGVRDMKTGPVAYQARTKRLNCDTKGVSHEGA